MDKRLAVLVDADNVAPRSAPLVFKEIATFGDATVRRIYGDFSKPKLKGWSNILNDHALVPHHQPENTTGKNSSDIALVIDAMDLLHSNRVDGFVLVASDGDYTRLASRIREQGLDVIGIGEEKTPPSFRRACKRFVSLENLKAQETSEGAQETSGNDAKKGKESAPKEPAQPSASISQQHPPNKVVPLIRQAMRTVEEEWVTVSLIGSHLHNADPEFDPRAYGSTKLIDLIERTGAFEVARKGHPVRVRLKTAKR